MRILCTNDDGIHAPGLQVVVDIAKALSDEVWVVAPETDQSGVSHSLSLNDPLRLRDVGERHFAVRGTPTDCVIMGVKHIMKDNPPDIILSGVNRGRNAAEDVTYSGTVAGAMEGSVLGIRSFALSQSFSAKTRQKPMWETGVRFGPDVVRKVLAANLPTDTIININFPDCPPEDVAGIAVTRQGKRNQDWLTIDARFDGRNNPYYWIAYQRGAAYDPPEEGTDLAALGVNYVSVTPLRLDLTHDAMMARMIDAIGKL